MKTNDIKYWDLIAKYFANECIDEEVDLLNQWIEQSTEHKNLFNEVKNDLEIINKYKAMERVNVDSAWDNLKSRIEADEKHEEKKKRTINFNRVLRYAAMIVVIAGLGFLFNMIYQENFGYYSFTEYTADNETSNEIVLPDGTKVYLNENSSLKYPEGFNGTQRKVKLTGEAFFDVTKNKDKPFIIDVKNAEIRVLGTSFNVRTNIDDSDVEVYVETGMVEVSRKKSGENNILVDPGNVGIVTKSEIKKQKNLDPNVLAWKTKNIVFREEHLVNVFNTLSRVYHVDIHAEDEEILNYRLTSTFTKQDIKSVMEVICVTFNLKVDYQNNRIIVLKN
ncbi:MAG: FecR domain-containing protein [Bacteroidota bacterium]|nr:FecR domain-containing protein [Bacteroidota bacterium]